MTIGEKINAYNEKIKTHTFITLNKVLNSVGKLPSGQGTGYDNHYYMQEIEKAFGVSRKEIEKLLLNECVNKFSDFANYYTISLESTHNSNSAVMLRAK